MKEAGSREEPAYNASADCKETRRAETRAAGVAGLLHHPELWRGGQLSANPAAITTGFEQLDEHLPGGGWPRAGLAECLLGTAGVGELRLLLPLIRSLTREQARWVAWVAPPFLPYAPALEASGVDISRILLIHPRTHQEALWALERASRSGTCSLVLAWLDERQLQLTDTRRVQLAARQGQTLACLFRPEQAAANPSMAQLRLAVKPAQPGHLNVDICKRRGGWPVSGLRLQVGAELVPQDIRERLAAWRQTHAQTEGPARPSASKRGSTALPARLRHTSTPGNAPGPGAIH